MPESNLLSPSDRLAWAVTLFLTAKEAKRVARRTLEAYSHALRRFTTWLQTQGITDPATLTPQHVGAYFVDLGKSDFASWTIHRYARPARSWLRLLFADGILHIDIVARVAMRRLDRAILPAYTALKSKTRWKLAEAAKTASGLRRSCCCWVRAYERPNFRVDRDRCGHQGGRGAAR